MRKLPSQTNKHFLSIFPTKIHFHLPIFLLIGLYFFLNLSLFLDKPSVWPDEALYHDVASNILNQGKLSSNLLTGLIPNVENIATWLPPLFFVTLASWFKLIGSDTIVTQRLLSTLLGILTLFLIFIFTKKVLPHPKSWWLTHLPVIGLITDSQFMRSFRLSRPETITIPLILLSTLSIACYHDLNHDNKSDKNQVHFFALGFLIGLAILAHPLATLFGISLPLFFIINQHWNQQALKQWLFYCLGFVLPLITWLISIRNFWPDLIQQFSLAAHRKSTETSWIIEVFTKSQNPFLQLIFVLLITTSLYTIYSSHKSKDKILQFLSSLLIISWVLSIVGVQLWYSIYILPFFYLTAVYQLNQSNLNSKFIYPQIIAALIVVNTIYTALITYAGLSKQFSYQQYTEQILNIIPDHATVFLSAIPDPYFGFIQAHRNNILIEFPVYQISLEQYASVLDSANYIIYSGSQSQVLFGNFLSYYIMTNCDQSYPVRAGDYQATIYQLKPQPSDSQPL